MLPLVSVLMPVHNALPYLQEALDSILKQTFGDYEFVIINDGSTDGSSEVLDGLSDPRVRLFRNGSSQGVVASLNAGLGVARGDFVARMDADDVSLPTRLEGQVSFLAAHPECILLGTAAILINRSGEPFYKTNHPETHETIVCALQRGNPFTHGSVMFRKTVIAEVGGYRAEALHAEDYDLWCRMAPCGRLGNLSEPLYRLRIHPTSVSARHLATQRESERAIRARCWGVQEPVSKAEMRRDVFDAHLRLAAMFRRAGYQREAVRLTLAAWRLRPWNRTALREMYRQVFPGRCLRGT